MGIKTGSWRRSAIHRWATLSPVDWEDDFVPHSRSSSSHLINLIFSSFTVSFDNLYHRIVLVFSVKLFFYAAWFARVAGAVVDPQREAASSVSKHVLRHWPGQKMPPRSKPDSRKLLFSIPPRVVTRPEDEVAMPEKMCKSSDFLLVSPELWVMKS